MLYERTDLTSILFLYLYVEKEGFKVEAMKLILKKNADKKEVREIERKLSEKRSRRGFNAKKYNGVLFLKEDPLTIQKELRDEWERDPG